MNHCSGPASFDSAEKQLSNYLCLKSAARQVGQAEKCVASMLLFGMQWTGVSQETPDSQKTQLQAQFWVSDCNMSSNILFFCSCFWPLLDRISHVVTRSTHRLFRPKHTNLEISAALSLFLDRCLLPKAAAQVWHWAWAMTERIEGGSDALLHSGTAHTMRLVQARPSVHPSKISRFRLDNESFWNKRRRC